MDAIFLCKMHYLYSNTLCKKHTPIASLPPICNKIWLTIETDIGGWFLIQIRVGKQKKKEKKKIYTENKIGRYVQFLIEREDFLELVASWLLSIEDERMQLLRQFIFEVELSETEELKNVLYQYGSYLTEKNYLERKFFEYMAELVRKMEQNRRAAALPAAIE